MRISWITWLASSAICLSSGAANATEIVNFVPGTYDLALYDFGPPVDTLTVTVSSGTAFFVLSGQDHATFTVPDGSTPSGDFGSDTSDYGGPYYIFAETAATASWDTVRYPAIVFWSTEDQGGFGSGYYGDDIYFFYESYTGPAQVFTISVVPELPSIVMLGAGLVGAIAMRPRRRR